MAQSTSKKSDRSTRDTWTWDKRFRSIFDSAMDAVITMGIDGRVIDWNKRAETCFGWSREEASGRLLAELIIPPSLRAAHFDGLKRFLETGESKVLNQRVEMTAQRKDGSQFPVELAITRLKIGAAVIFNAFARDVSAQKQEAERRRQETLEAKLLHQAATLSLADQTFDEALRNCVSIICEVTGWPVGHVYLPDHAAGRLVSSGIWRIADPDRFAAIRRVTEETQFLRGVGIPGNIWLKREPVWVEDVNKDPDLLCVRKLPDPGIKGVFGFPVVYGQEVAAVLEFFHDEVIAPDPALMIMVHSIGKQLGYVVERRRWFEERDYLASIVESSNDAIIARSLEGTILAWNRGAERIYGYQAGEAIGQPGSIIIPGDLAPEEPEIRDVLRHGARLEHLETRRRRKNGDLLDVSITVSPIRNSDGKIIGSSTIERDVTLQKKRARELQIAKESAEAANRTKSEFLANVSHELRTPMNAVIGMLELARGETLTDVMADYLQTAHDSAQSLSLLLNDLLDFSRIEAGRFELETHPFSLRDLLDSTLKMLSLRASEKGLELACRVGRDVPDKLSGDAKRLKQIVVNLVGNAIKFTEQGEVVMDVNVDTHGDSQAELEFVVIDTGIGIAERDRARIFAPFTQADASTTRQYPGTGLGLAICQELVTRMGGRLWLESEPGTGSRFHFTARLSVLSAGHPRTARQAGLIDRLHGLRVLVVDDNTTNCRILEEMLTNWRIRPTIVGDGAAAIEALQASRGGESFELLIVDALMPAMDGFLLIEETRRRGLLTGAAVLMLSSADRQSFQDRCDPLNVACYLEKPVSQSDLLDAIATALHGPAPGGTPSASASGTPADVSETAEPLRILLAEDTPANRKVVTAILSKRGHEVVPANNGREAVDLIDQQDFDVVLMDLQMPTMDGFQATEAIRNTDDAAANVPIVAITAHNMRGDCERCLAAGMDAYLSKPLKAAQLIETVERLGTLNRVEGGGRRAEGGRRKAEGGKRKAEGGKRKAEDGQDTTHHSPLTTPSIDRDAVLQRLGGDADLFADMLTYFREDAPQLLQSLRDAVRCENAPEIARSAHSLKGLAANLGDRSLAEAASAVERAGAAGDSDRAAALLEGVERGLEATLLEVGEW